LKIDIEGNELRALQGARRIIERDHPTIVTEINPVCLGWGGAKPADVIEFLKSFGYSIQRLDSSNIYASMKSTSSTSSSIPHSNTQVPGRRLPQRSAPAQVHARCAPWRALQFGCIVAQSQVPIQ
jgi:hypothetical protein